MRAGQGDAFCGQYRGLASLTVLILGGFISLLIFAWPASRALNPGFASEFLNHARLLKDLEAQQVPFYSLWYALQKLIVGSDLSVDVLTASGLLLIGAFAFLKGVLLTGLLTSAGYSPFSSLAGGFLLGTAIALPLPFVERYSSLYQVKVYYLGTLPPNTFMSATQLVANVGVLPAFFSLRLWGRSQNLKSYLVMLVACLIASLCKSGIAPPLFCGITLSIAINALLRKSFGFRQVYQILIAAVILLTPSLIIGRSYMSGSGWRSIQAVVAPFETWKAFSSHIPADLFASFAFPILVILVLLSCLVRSSRGESGSMRSELQGLLPCRLTACVALLMFIVLAEKVNGQPFHSGNFAWGAISANAGLHLVALIAIRQLGLASRLFLCTVLGSEAAWGLLSVAGYVRIGTFI